MDKASQLARCCCLWHTQLPSDADLQCKVDDAPRLGHRPQRIGDGVQQHLLVREPAEPAVQGVQAVQAVQASQAAVRWSGHASVPPSPKGGLQRPCCMSFVGAWLHLPTHPRPSQHLRCSSTPGTYHPQPPTFSSVSKRVEHNRPSPTPSLFKRVEDDGVAPGS